MKKVVDKSDVLALSDSSNSNEEFSNRISSLETLPKGISAGLRGQSPFHFLSNDSTA